MRLSDAQMYDRFVAGDPAFDGRFFTGVATTGIYCLPSCRAKKPKRTNVRFFPTCEAAREAGFRACRKCHPDDFARGADPLLEATEALVQEIRPEPARFPDVRSIVRRIGFGTTRVFELFRQHYHATPAEILTRARLDQAQKLLLESAKPLAQVAHDAGYESLSVLHAHFKTLVGMTPSAYRSLPESDRFSITLPPGYPLPYLRRALSRDVHSVNERWAGECYEAAVRLEGEPALLRLDFGEEKSDGIRVGVRVVAGLVEPAGRGRRPRPQVAAYRVVRGLTGLDQDAAAFSRLARRLGFARLVEGRPELRISQTTSVFDGLIWAIVGQQINLPFACLLKRRLFELAGTPLGNGLVAPPTPQAVAALTPEALRPLQYSQKKAEYLISAAKLVAGGTLDLEGLKRGSATRAERTLLEIHGLGPWSVNYIMMRALGFSDCVPLGDTGVSSGLKHLFSLETRPDADDTRRLMSIFSPHRSLATSHLWQLLQSPP
ncbi:MAG TPA: Ada metal-binding domain-containing protein [Opitutaceae bacterium]|jgi:AraC family transcriptional regulator of adaptative response / DNA-3-methyladenine glycosylase II